MAGCVLLAACAMHPPISLIETITRSTLHPVSRATQTVLYPMVMLKTLTDQKFEQVNWVSSGI